VRDKEYMREKVCTSMESECVWVRERERVSECGCEGECVFVRLSIFVAILPKAS